MTKFLNPTFEAQFRSVIYRFRFLGLYILFGILSIILEFFSRYYFIGLNIGVIPSTFLAISIGIMFAYWANVKFNFKIPKSRRNRSLLYFIIISCFSGFIQWSLKTVLAFDFLSYESARLIISGLVFFVAYLLHRKYSFRDFKKVGVAIYANGIEDLKKIHERIGQYPDFIHVDVVDKTMSQNAQEVKTYRLETMKAYWPTTQVQSHIMSKKPSLWLEQVLQYSDVVYVHAECDEDVNKLLKKIQHSGKKAGLALTMATDPNKIVKLLEISDYVLLLTIPQPGSSGQKFDPSGLDKIKQINNLTFRNNFVLCIDGGVNENIVSMLEAENIVSGSSVLKNKDPKKQIMRLQTLGRYEA